MSNKFWHHSSLQPHSAAGSDEEKKVKEDVGGSKADHDQGTDDGILPDSVETSLRRGRLMKFLSKSCLTWRLSRVVIVMDFL